jgi:hypothetical protein
MKEIWQKGGKDIKVQWDRGKIERKRVRDKNTK